MTGVVLILRNDDTMEAEKKDEIDLRYMQRLVGGNIERVRIGLGGHLYDMWVNEDGIRLGLPLNRGASYLYRKSKFNKADVEIYGNVFFTRGDDEEDCNPMDGDETSNLVLHIVLGQVHNYKE